MKYVIHTNFDYPPIPDRSFDWSAVTEDYDGAPDAGRQAVGRGRTEKAAILDLIEQMDEMQLRSEERRAALARELDEAMDRYPDSRPPQKRAEPCKHCGATGSLCEYKYDHFKPAPCKELT